MPLYKVQVDTVARIGHTAIVGDIGGQIGHSVIEIMKTIRAIDIIVLFRWIPPHTIRVNFRSKTAFDVAGFAAQWGGGGHRRASGVVIAGSLEDFDEVCCRIISALSRQLTVA